MSKDDHGVMHERKVLTEQTHQLGRSDFREPLKLVYGRIGIGSIRQQRQERTIDCPGHQGANVLEVASGGGRVRKADIGGNFSFGMLSSVHQAGFYISTESLPKAESRAAHYKRIRHPSWVP